MVLPVLAWLAGLAVVGVWVTSRDDIATLWTGKKLAVLGARGVGKTHLIQFMTKGSMPTDYKQTVAPNKTQANKFELNGLSLRIKENLDVSGDKAAYAEWKQCAEEADVLLYLLRADRLLAHDEIVENRIKSDLQHIAEWLEKHDPRKPFFIIGTHCDLDESYPGGESGQFGSYLDRFRQLDAIHEFLFRCGGSERVKIIIGSLKNLSETQSLGYKLLQQVPK
jgi:hypothetical protein